MSFTIFIIALLGTLPIIIAWVLDKRGWLIPATILSIIIAVGSGNPAYAVIDLAFVGIVAYLAFSSMAKGSDHKDTGDIQ